MATPQSSPPSEGKVIVAEHIERDRLYTDRVYRFKYIAKFAEFGAADIDAIHAAAPVLAPLVPTVVDLVYQKLFSFDITKAVFLKRNEGFKGADLPDDLSHLTLDSSQIKFRKEFLGKYLVKLVTAKYDDNFINYLDWVGRIHTNTPEKKSKINVELIHCNALFAYVSSVLVNAVLTHEGLDLATKTKTVLAFNKLLWIQNDFFSRHYVRDGDDLVNPQKSVLAKNVGLVCPFVFAGVVGVAAAYFFQVKA